MVRMLCTMLVMIFIGCVDPGGMLVVFTLVINVENSGDGFYYEVFVILFLVEGN